MGRRFSAVSETARLHAHVTFLLPGIWPVRHYSTCVLPQSSDSERVRGRCKSPSAGRHGARLRARNGGVGYGAWARSSGAESQFDQVAAERRNALLENVATAVRSILGENGGDPPPSYLSSAETIAARIEGPTQRTVPATRSAIVPRFDYLGPLGIDINRHIAMVDMNRLVEQRETRRLPPCRSPCPCRWQCWRRPRHSWSICSRCNV